MVLHTGDFKMDQLPLDGRLTDLRAFARLGDGGRRPVPGRLDQRRGARASPPPSGTSRPVLDRVFAPGRAARHRRVLRQPRAPRAAGARRRRTRTAARSPSSAARWCATWASPATSATCTCPAGCWSTSKQLDDLPRRRDRAGLHRLAGRADGGAVADGQPRPPVIRDRRGRHRDPRVVAHPGQRERRLPGHQRADPVGRQGRAQGQRDGARLGSRVSAGELLYCYNIVRPRNVMPVHGEWRHLRANADLAVATGVPRDRIVLAEDGVVVDLVDGRREHRRRGAVRLRLRRRLQRRRHHRGVAEGPAHPGRRGLHLGRRRRRLGDRQGRPAARRSTRAASPRTTRSSTRSRPQIEEALEQGRRRGHRRRPPARSRSSAGRWATGSATPTAAVR